MARIGLARMTRYRFLKGGRGSMKPRETSGVEQSLPLLEREDELDSLREAIASAAEGKGSLSIVEGPAGIGKTRLLLEATVAGKSSGFLVLRARGGEMEREMPFGLARQLFDPLLERATDDERSLWFSGNAEHALAALGRAGLGSADTDRFTPINGLYWLVANLSELQPVLVIVDDIHWGDSDSLRFIVFLGRRLADLSVCVMLGARTGETDEPEELRALRLESSLLRPRALSAASVHELITTRSGEPPSDGFSAACAEATAGNPFLIVEILREFDAEGRKPDDSATDSIADVAPDTVARAVLFRLGRFGDDAIALARAIAVMGRAPDLRHAAKLAGLDEDRAVEVCDRLRAAEVLAAGTPVEFVHPLVRQAIYKEQSEGERSGMHKRAAELLMAEGADRSVVAAHLIACPPRGDHRVAEVLTAAAAQAQQEGALATAVRFLDRALREPPDDPFPLLGSIGMALVETEPFRAPVVLKEALELASGPSDRVLALRNLAWAQIAIGDLLGGADASDEALQLADPSDRDLVLALEAQAYFLRSAGSGITPELSERIERIASGLSGETSGEMVARQALAIDRFARCEPVDQTIALCLPCPDPPWEIAGMQSPVPFAAIKILAWSGHREEARRELELWNEVVQASGRITAVSVAHSFMSEVERLSGRIIEAEALARTAWDIAESAGRFSSYGWSALMNLAATLLVRGNVDGFEALIGDFDLSAGPMEVPLNPWPLEIRAQYRRAKGDLEGSVADHLAMGEACARVGIANPAMVPWRQEAAETLALLGRTTEARDLLDEAAGLAASYGAPDVIASVQRARAMLEPRKRAIEGLANVAAHYEENGPPHELARSLLELGSALRREGQRSTARDPLSRALELAHRCGAGGLEDRARDELHAIGSRPRTAYRTGIGALTASELRVARLAAKGLNNREIAERIFVTRRTVETHLTHAYEKLGIAGRAELASALGSEETAVS